MADPVSNKPVTLGGMVLAAQKKAAAILANPASAATADEPSRLADQVDLSETARAKLATARKVSGFLSVFSSFLKGLNAPQYGIKPVKSGLEQHFELSQKRLFDKKI